MEWTENLIQRMVAGEDSAYEQVVESEWAHAVRTAWLILRNPHDAEEAAQEAFVNLYKHRHQLRDPVSMRAWFFKILINCARQQLRQQRNHVPIEGQETRVPMHDPMPHMVNRIAIRDALLQLPEDERIALVLCYFAELTDDEAAAAAGWNRGKYKYRLASGRRHLSALMSPAEATVKHKGGYHNA